jgi:hypothetical protein
MLLYRVFQITRQHHQLATCLLYIMHLSDAEMMGPLVSEPSLATDSMRSSKLSEAEGL